jgi:uncharacterized protein (TIGR02145 family)
MDRNLGASRVALSSTDDQAYGDLYQWGRGADGHQCRNSATTSTFSSTDQPGHGDFILSSGTPYDWRNPQNDNLWQGINGINNPCPIGYRVPTEVELNSELLSWLDVNSNSAFNSSLKFTVAGFKSATNAGFNSVDNFGTYWSSTNIDIGARYLFFSDTAANISNDVRALGFSVRCIKD